MALSLKVYFHSFILAGLQGTKKTLKTYLTSIYWLFRHATDWSKQQARESLKFSFKLEIFWKFWSGVFLSVHFACAPQTTCVLLCVFAVLCCVLLCGIFSFFETGEFWSAWFLPVHFACAMCATNHLCWESRLPEQFTAGVNDNHTVWMTISQNSVLNYV